MVMMFAQADRIMLKFMMSSEAMGYYSAAVVCANLTEFVFLAIIDSFRSTIIEKKVVSQLEYESLLQKLYSVIIYLSLFQSIAITILAKPIILILYGKAYLPAVVPLKIIVWYTAFSYLGSARIIWILAEKQETLLWKINLFGAILNIILNWFMIPIGGIAGAATASLLTQFAVNFLVGYFIEPLRKNNTLIIQSCRLSVISRVIFRR
jgi:O-antigen/teichoic acid export membrane protein